MFMRKACRHADRRRAAGAARRHRAHPARRPGAHSRRAGAPAEEGGPRGHAVLHQPRPARAGRAQGAAAATCCRRTRSPAPTATSARWRSSCARCAPPAPRSPWCAPPSAPRRASRWPSTRPTGRKSPARISGDDTIFIATAGRCGRSSELIERLRTALSGLNHATNAADRAPSPSCSPIPAASTPRSSCPGSPRTRAARSSPSPWTPAASTPRPRRRSHERALRARRHRAPPGRRARGLLRAGAALPDHGQRAPRPALSAVRRRRARHAGADHRAHGARSSAPTWSRTAARPRATTRCASKWRCARSRRTSRCSRRCATRRSSAQEELDYLSARGLPVPPYGAALFGQSRPVGRDHRRQGDADLRGQHPRERLGADARRVRRSRARAAAPRASRFEQGVPVGARRQGARRRSR